MHEGDQTKLLSGYVKTQSPRKTLGPDESYGIFALDCEMVSQSMGFLFNQYGNGFVLVLYNQWFRTCPSQCCKS